MGDKRPPPQFQNSSKTYVTSMDITGATQSALMDKISALEAIGQGFVSCVLHFSFLHHKNILRSYLN